MLEEEDEDEENLLLAGTGTIEEETLWIVEHGTVLFEGKVVSTDKFRPYDTTLLFIAVPSVVICTRQGERL